MLGLTQGFAVDAPNSRVSRSTISTNLSRSDMGGNGIDSSLMISMFKPGVVAPCSKSRSLDQGHDIADRSPIVVVIVLALAPYQIRKSSKNSDAGFTLVTSR